MSVSLRIHGGGCCGVRHLAGFYGRDMRGLRQSFENVPKGRLVEAVLLFEQAERFGDALAYLGFKPTLTFINGNTGNILWVFHYHSDKRTVLPEIPVEELPFSFDAEKGEKILNKSIETFESLAEVRRGMTAFVTKKSRSKLAGMSVTIVGITWDGICRVRNDHPFYGTRYSDVRWTSLKPEIK